jgi:hypothetical protein
MSQGGNGDQGYHRHAGLPRMPWDGQQEHIVGGAGAEAEPSHTLVVPFDHASDGAVDSEDSDGAVDSKLLEARRGFANEPDAQPNRRACESVCCRDSLGARG